MRDEKVRREISGCGVRIADRLALSCSGSPGHVDARHESKTGLETERCLARD